MSNSSLKSHFELGYWCLHEWDVQLMVLLLPMLSSNWVATGKKWKNGHVLIPNFNDVRVERNVKMSSFTKIICVCCSNLISLSLGCLSLSLGCRRKKVASGMWKKIEIVLPPHVLLSLEGFGISAIVKRYRWTKKYLLMEWKKINLHMTSDIAFHRDQWIVWGKQVELLQALTLGLQD